MTHTLSPVKNQAVFNLSFVTNRHIDIASSREASVIVCVQTLLQLHNKDQIRMFR